MSLIVAILIVAGMFWYIRKLYREAFRIRVTIVNGRQAMVLESGQDGVRWAECVHGRWFWEDTGRPVERKMERLIEMAQDT